MTAEKLDAPDAEQRANQSNIDSVVKKNKSALRGCYIFGGTQAVSSKVESMLKAASK